MQTGYPRSTSCGRCATPLHEHRSCLGYDVVSTIVGGISGWFAGSSHSLPRARTGLASHAERRPADSVVIEARRLSSAAVRRRRIGRRTDRAGGRRRESRRGRRGEPAHDRGRRRSSETCVGEGILETANVDCRGRRNNSVSTPATDPAEQHLDDLADLVRHPASRPLELGALDTADRAANGADEVRVAVVDVVRVDGFEPPDVVAEFRPPCSVRSVRLRKTVTRSMPDLRVRLWCGGHSQESCIGSAAAGTRIRWSISLATHCS